jgi:hypothetical protein
LFFLLFISLWSDSIFVYLLRVYWRN